MKEALLRLYDVEIVRCWIDSITACYWVRGTENHWKLFVENRVQEIRKLVSPRVWSHCPGHEIPADIPTRKIKFSNLNANNIWWNGPGWLSHTEDTWPNDKCVRNQRKILEMKEADRNDSFALHSQVEKYPHVSSIIGCDRSSSYSKLLRVTSYVFRFIKYCRSKDKNIDELNSDELNEAECAWIRDMQSCIPKKKLKDLELHIGNFEDEKGII